MPQDINGSCIVDVVCCAMRRGWRVKEALQDQDSSRSRETPRYNWPRQCPARAWTFLADQSISTPAFSAAGERAKTRSEPGTPTQSRELPGTCSAPHRPRPAATVTSKTRGLNGCVRDGSFSTTAKPFQGRTLMTWMSSDRLEHILFAKEPCDFSFPLFSHFPFSNRQCIATLLDEFQPCLFRVGHECIAWPP